MDEEDFLLLDDEEEEVNSPSEKKSKSEKAGESSWLKVSDAITKIPFRIKESSDIKNIGYVI